MKAYERDSAYERNTASIPLLGRGDFSSVVSVFRRFLLIVGCGRNWETNGKTGFSSGVFHAFTLGSLPPLVSGMVEVKGGVNAIASSGRSR